jgi:gas vesicle protein
VPNVDTEGSPFPKDSGFIGGAISCLAERIQRYARKGAHVTRFLLGFGVGVGLGMIFAPASGSETRARLREKAENLADLPRKKAAQIADISKEKAGELGAQIGRQTAESAVDAVKENVLGEDKTA